MKTSLTCFLLAVTLIARAQHGDSIEFNRQYRVMHAVAAPVILAVAGLGVHPFDERIAKEFQREGEIENPKASMQFADYTQYAPILLAYSLTAFGQKGEHDFLKKTSLLLQSEAIMVAAVYSTKQLTNRTRPDGSQHSFPSGHTAQAFLAATFLHKEFGHKNVWYSVAGYTMASAVGVCRMVSNRHWASDVLVGAGVGVLSANLVYLNHKHRKNKNQITALPTYMRGPGLTLVMKL